MITVNDLLAIAGTKKGNDVTAKLADAINRHAAKYGISNQKRLSQFLANTCVETWGFTKLEENLNYSVSGLLKGFGRHRISKADAQRLGRSSTRKADQRAIANTIYGGAFGREHLGNVNPNDGWDYRGSGLGQVTGRANFARVEKETGLPVVAKPDLLREAENGTIAAMILWQKWGLNELADQGATDEIRRRWNGGTKGLVEVREAYSRARGLGLSVPAVVHIAPEPEAPAPAPEPVEPPKPAASAPKAGAAVAVAGGAIAALAAWWNDITTWIGGFFQ